MAAASAPSSPSVRRSCSSPCSLHIARPGPGTVPRPIMIFFILQGRFEGLPGRGRTRGPRCGPQANRSIPPSFSSGAPWRSTRRYLASALTSPYPVHRLERIRRAGTKASGCWLSAVALTMSFTQFSTGPVGCARWRGASRVPRSSYPRSVS